MAIDFSSINLEVLDISTNVTPEIFVNQNGITFSKRIVEDLGYAQTVQYCTDPAKHIFAIRACKGNETRASAFSKPKSEQSNTLSFCNKNLHDTVAALIPDYSPKARYRVVGEFDTENRIMYFDMATAEVAMFRTVKE